MTEVAQKPEDMTDAEWDALNSDEGGLNPDDDTPIAGDDELEALAATGNEQQTDEEKAAADAAAAAAAAASAEETKEQPPAPVLVVQPPADAEAKLTEIATKKADLASKFDDGELSAKDYQLQLDALNKDERAIELQVHEANMAAKMAAQQARNSFLAEVKSFTEEVNPLYKQSAVAWKALDEAVKKVGSDPENANLTGKQILEKAHEIVTSDPVLKAAFGASRPAKAAAPRAADAPPTLGRMPAAEITDTSGDKFAALDRLSSTNPLAYEEAVGKLSPSDLEAYLSR